MKLNFSENKREHGSKGGEERKMVINKKVLLARLMEKGRRDAPLWRRRV